MEFPQTVLIVEDDSIIGQDLAQCLEDLGLNVCGLTGDAAEAAQLADTHRPDLLTMDVDLNGHQAGIAAAIVIRAVADTPIVFVTGYADPDTYERMITLSRTAVVEKPFDSPRMQQAIMKALGRTA